MSSEHQVVDDEADHPGDYEHRAGSEELALGLLAGRTVQEDIQHECAKADRYESHGDEIHAERCANDKADDRPGYGRVDVSEYCHASLSIEGATTGKFAA